MAKAEPPPAATPFAARLKALRQAADLTQAQLAGRAGLHVGAAFKLEQGVREPSWATVQALCKALGVPWTAFDAEGEAEGPADQPRRPGRPRKAAGGPAPKKTTSSRKGERQWKAGK
jgi:transcriptional regulator with XRE-family HTH domain